MVCTWGAGSRNGGEGEKRRGGTWPFTKMRLKERAYREAANLKSFKVGGGRKRMQAGHFACVRGVPIEESEYAKKGGVSEVNVTNQTRNRGLRGLEGRGRNWPGDWGGGGGGSYGSSQVLGGTIGSGRK